MQSVRFDRAVEYYDQTRGFPPGEEQAVAALIARAGGLTRASRVLEIGIGTGRIALPLAAHAGDYFGIDLSRPMLEKLLAKRADEAVRVVEGDATRLPFAPGIFDAAVTVHVFHLIPAWQTALDELRRTLKPGAPLVHCWTREDHELRPLWEAWKSVVPHEQQADVGVPWQDNKTFLEGAGWQPVAVEQTYTYTFERAPISFLDALRNRIWSSTWRLTDDELAQAVTASQAIIAERFPNPEQPRRVHSTFVARAYLPPAS